MNRAVGQILLYTNGIYDPGIGRFLSPDPIIGDPFDGQAFNRYSYARNNPLSYTDPTGLQADGGDGNGGDGNGGDGDGGFSESITVYGNPGVGTSPSSQGGRPPPPNPPPTADDGGTHTPPEGTPPEYTPVEGAPVLVTPEFQEEIIVIAPPRWAFGTASQITANFESAFYTLAHKLGLRSDPFLPTQLSDAYEELIAQGIYDPATECVCAASAPPVLQNKAVPMGAGQSTKGLFAPVKWHQHHLLPRAWRTWFAQYPRNINIDLFTVRLSEGQHLKDVHGKGNAILQGRWVGLWDDFIGKHPNATAKEVYQHLGRMMDEFGLHGIPIVPY